MLMRCLRAEQRKLRRSAIWLAILLLPLLGAIFGTFNYLNNAGILTHQWYSLWTQHTLFYCYFFAPLLVGVYCAYLCRLEHLNHNWNAVMTAPVSVSCVFLSKLITAGGLLLITQLFTGLLFVLSGILCGLTEPIPAELSGWLLLGWWGGLAATALQLCLSMFIRSFAVPVGLALLGGIAGLCAVIKGLGLYFPYSYLLIGMDANNPEPGQLLAGNGAEFFLFSTGYLVLFCALGIGMLKSRDVAAV